MLERAAQVAGFEAAVTVMNQIVAAGRSIDAGEVEVVATRAREQPVQGEHEHDASLLQDSSRVDLSVYDRFTQVAA